VAGELERRGYRWTALTFHLTGISFPSWDYAFMMGCPRHKDAVLSNGKPTITTMGKPESREEHAAVGRKYLPEYDALEMEMARTIMRSEKVVFMSDFVKEIWKKIFILRGYSFPAEDRVRVIFHGVDTSLFTPSPEPPPPPFVLGSVGALRETFRLRTLFEVSRRLGFGHRLMIVGSMTSECREEFDKAVRDPKLASRITYVPWVEAQKLPDYYRRMHCLFHPVDYEGFGIVVAEALSCGIPVVVPAHGAPKEFVTAEAGIAVETRQFHYDEDYCSRMADAVSRIRAGQEKYSRGARLCAERVLTIERKVEEYLTFMGLPLTA
jgi:glycosyltransferase involved in cell wall biosynthesis